MNHGQRDRDEIVIEDREELIFLLSEAASLEHMVMCSYLYAAFSLKRGGEDLSPKELADIRRWDGTVTQVAIQEMLHLALVNNILTAVGGAPNLVRPNFPVRSKYFSSTIQMVLMPFGEEALRHFLYLERPDAVHLRDAVSLRRRLVDSGVHNHVELLAVGQEFSTIGDLYRGVEKGLRHLAGKYGERQLFAGPTGCQASPDHFGWKELVTVRDLQTATDALNTIILEGEGARGDWRTAHFGRFLDIHDEHARIKSSRPSFEPANPVIPAYLRQHTDTTEPVAIIADPVTLRVAELFNSAYGVSIQVLTRFFLHADSPEGETQVLADAAVRLMSEVIRPLGQLMTTLPVGPAHPGKTAGPAFEILRRTSYILPHRRAAWAVLHERLTEMAEYAAAATAPARVQTELRPVTQSLREMASTFEVHARGGRTE